MTLIGDCSMSTVHFPLSTVHNPPHPGRSMMHTMPRRIRAILLAFGVLAAPSGHAGARPQAPEPPVLVPQEQGVEDVGPLGATLRVGGDDLRVPTDFEHVYRRPDGGLMRIDGALHAVFRESDYVATRRGLVPVIPAGTTWVIGEPSAGCSQPAKPVCAPSEAHGPFVMQGPMDLRPKRGLRHEPTPPGSGGSVAPVALPRAEMVGGPIADDRAGGTPVGERIEPARVSAERAPAEPTACPRGMPDSFDLSDPFYRYARLREIAKRHGPR